MKDYYYILGVDVNSTHEQVKLAYYKLAQKFHPDKNNQDPFFEEHFKEIQEAYETLSNPPQRETYNKLYGWEKQNSTSYFSSSQRDVNFTESIKVNGMQINTIEMIFVHGGSFEFGGTHPQAHIPHKKAARTVLVNSFYIGKFPITQTQWQCVMDYQKSNVQKLFSKKSPIKTYQSMDCPISGLSWQDSLSFVKKLNEMTNRNYRLPSEAEWEYAALGGQKSRGYLYSGGNDLHDVAWTHETSAIKSFSKIGGTEYHGKLYPIGLKNANELGLYDMSGGVWEFCSDHLSNSIDRKVLKGGCYSGYKWDAEIKASFYAHKNEQRWSAGLRLALDY